MNSGSNQAQAVSGAQAQLDALAGEITVCLERLQSLRNDLDRQASDVTARQAAILEQETQLRLLEQEQAALREAAEAERKELAREREAFEVERQQFAEKLAKTAEAEAQFEKRSAELDQQGKELASLQAELSARREALAAEAAALAAKQSELQTAREAQSAEFEERSGAQQARESELGARAVQLEAEAERQRQRTEEFVALELDFQRREEVIAKFQTVFSQMAQAFIGSSPNAPSLQEMHAAARQMGDPTTLSAASAAAEAHERASSGESRPEPRAESKGSANREPAPHAPPVAEPVAADAPANAEPTSANDEPEEHAPDSVDTVDFTSEEVEKLRVLRRLGGGLTDGQLVARIRAERRRSGEPRAEKAGKKRWW